MRAYRRPLLVVAATVVLMLSFSGPVVGAGPPYGYQARVHNAVVYLTQPEINLPEVTYNYYITMSIGQDHGVGPGGPVGRWCTVYVEQWKYDSVSQQEQYRYWGYTEVDPALCLIENGASARSPSMTLDGFVAVDVPFWGIFWVWPSTWTWTGDETTYIDNGGESQVWVRWTGGATFSSDGLTWANVEYAWVENFVQVAMP